MNSTEYMDFWEKSHAILIKSNKDKLKGFKGLNDSTIDFLVSSGLPDDVLGSMPGPFLCFDELEETKFASEYHSLENTYEYYLVIGHRDRLRLRTSSSDWESDLVCIDTKNKNQIILLLSEENYRVQYINSSIQQLSDSLISFTKIINKVGMVYGKDRELCYEVNESIIEKLGNELNKIDPQAMEKGSFWEGELSRLLIRAQTML